MVIGLSLEEEAFEQDIRELFMAFYPGAVFVYGETEVCRALAEEKCLSAKKSGTERKHCEKQCEKTDEKCFLDRMAEGRFHTDENGERIGYSLRLRRFDKEEVEEEIQPFPIVPGDRKETKNRIKRRLYRLLSQDTGKTLPWGALTGIRPVKIAAQKLSEGWKDERILEYMENQYYVGEKKRKLSLEIAQEEQRLLETVDYPEGYSLYVGIPFCPTTCLYCSFTSYPIARWKDKLEEYLDCLCRELLMIREQMSGKKKLQTVYIGGGTPTSLPEEQLERLLSQVREAFSGENIREFTVEAGRPDSITREKLRIMKRHDIDRISINPQSMNQKTLDLIGRRHTVEQVEAVFAMAREEGFDNINMDIILGLPGELREEAAYTLEKIRRLDPDSLTVHCLALKRAARLNQEKEQYAGYPMASGALIDELVDLAADEARAMGMKPYYLYRQKNMAGNLENTGYAREGKACLYNLMMMEEKHSVIACGAGSTSKRVYPDGRIERCENVKDVALYIEKIDEMTRRKRKLLMD